MNEQTTNRSALAQLLHAAMTRRGIRTSRALAVTLDISAEYVRRIVNGQSVPTEPVLRKICEQLHVPVSKAIELARTERAKGELFEQSLGDERYRTVGMLWSLLPDEARSEIVRRAVEAAKRARA